eukprot:1156383-Pelagomonas_calceolata.AAC.5
MSPHFPQHAPLAFLTKLISHQKKTATLDDQRAAQVLERWSSGAKRSICCTRKGSIKRAPKLLAKGWLWGGGRSKGDLELALASRQFQAPKLAS